MQLMIRKYINTLGVKVSLHNFILCFLSPQLSQTVSDLTTVLYLKEAELQYWQSR